MAIKDTHFPTEPTIKINGTRIKLDGTGKESPLASASTEAYNAAVSTKSKKTGTSSITVTKSKPKIFRGPVVVSLEALDDTYSTHWDTTGQNTTYKNRPTYIASTDVTGKVNKIGSTVNDKVEIYYSVNGKEPQRTKSYLYTGPITFNNNRLHDTVTDSGQAKRRNNTGGGASSDNVVFKAKAYYKGQWSKTAVAEFRIVKAHGSTTI